MKLSRALAVFAVLLTVACGDGELSVQYPSIGPDNLRTVASALRASERAARATMIRDAAAGRGLSNGVLLAGIAEAETNLAHCWSEATWACQGPASSSCGGGPVIAGSADGPCSARQGGLGMFQFDAGTHAQTLAREGNRILTVEGNTQAAVDFIVHKVKNSDFVPNVGTDAEALAWMNALRPDTREWDQWIRTVTGYYNGCFEGRCSKFHARYNNYDQKTRNMLAEFGADFWQAGAAASHPASSQATTPVAGRPGRAYDLSPANASFAVGSAADLGWSAVDAATFTVRVDYFADGEWRHYYEWTRRTNVFELWPQVPNTSYRWAVQACNAHGCADWSDWATFTYGAAASPQGSNGGSASNGGTSGGGTASNGSSNGGSATSTGSTTTNTSANDTNTSTNESDTSTASNTPAPAPQANDNGLPGMPGSMSPAGGRIDTANVPLRWSQPFDADTYDIVMYFHDGAEWRDYYLWTGKRNGAFDVWPVRDETYYAWAIRACNSMGCSDWSDFQQFYFGGL